MAFSIKKKSILPGFGISMGITLSYLGLVVLIPLSFLFLKTMSLGWQQFWDLATDPRALASYRLSFGAAFISALANMIFGVLVAWVLVRYDFPGRRVFDSFVDLPFALPTSVAGIALTAMYSSNGWLGKPLESIGIKAAYSRLGIVIALTFIGLPFVVRTVQPVLEEMGRDMEEAAASLGATPRQVFSRVIVPTILPAVLTGFTMAFSRAVGEYGSVVFISGNMPMRTEVAPLLIVTRLEQYDYSGATAIATVLLIISFLVLLALSMLQRLTRHHRA